MAHKFHVKTFGCQMNKNDSLIAASLLCEAGFEETEDAGSADIIIVNTCSVRQHAEDRALAHVSGLQKWRSQGGRALCVVGCLAVDRAHEISRAFEFVDLILGPDSYRRMAGYLSDVLSKGTRIIDVDTTAETYCGIHAPARSVSSFVSIMRGCSNYCSYCVVPYVRGNARSRPTQDIFDEITQLARSGVKEIILLGQNVNEYQYETFNFAGLLEAAAQIPGISRIRFLTSHPKDFSSRTIKAVKDNPRICEWFHLPMQSGNDRILDLMNRKYTIDHYLGIVDSIRKEIPRAAVTTDVIVGFPTETEEEFRETIRVMEKVRFDDAYTYRYSTRPGTKASQMPALDESVVKERLKTLIAVQQRIIKEKTHEMLGTTCEILFETRARRDGWRGKTRGNKDIIVQGRIEPGTVRNVVIKEIRGHTPIGVLID